MAKNKRPKNNLFTSPINAVKTQQTRVKNIKKNAKAINQKYGLNLKIIEGRKTVK